MQPTEPHTDDSSPLNTTPNYNPVTYQQAAAQNESALPVTESRPAQEAVDPNLRPGDRQLLIIKRHPFGLVSMYMSAIGGLVIAFTLLFLLVPSVLSGDLGARVMRWLIIFAILTTALVIVVLLVATSIYRQNKWVVTDETVHQVLQKGLFSSQSSELSMANIEDVTAEQKGILAKMFNFGTIRVETAGELPYFHFNYCPTPEKYAQIIINARERFINSDPAAANRANELLNVPGERRS
ncbi:MAG: hypothetical protein NVS1B7_0130 [Candidatus Saccharimonadales bacterium]